MQGTHHIPLLFYVLALLALIYFGYNLRLLFTVRVGKEEKYRRLRPVSSLANALTFGIGQRGAGLNDVEHRPERHLAGGTDGLESPFSVFDAGQLDDDRPLTLDGDLGLLNRAKTLDAPPHDLDGRVECVGIRAVGPHEHDREAALQVETELWGPIRQQHGADRSPRNGERDDQRDDRGLSIHSESSPTRSATARLAMRMVEPPPMSIVNVSPSSDRTVP